MHLIQAFILLKGFDEMNQITETHLDSTSGGRYLLTDIAISSILLMDRAEELWKHQCHIVAHQAYAAVSPALWNDTPPALSSAMLQGILPASLRSLKTSFHLTVTLRAPLNSLL